MIALIVKPSLRDTSRLYKVLAELKLLEPVVLTGATKEELESEITELWKRDSELTVAACGGDGTFHLALNSLPSLDIPLAVIPLGTGNDFARYVGLTKPTHTISVLKSSVPCLMDIGTITLDDGSIVRFAGIASCGFDAQVNERANTYRGPAGTLKYLAALVMELANLNSRYLTISIDAEPSRSQDFTLVAVGNTSSYGGGLKMCPTASAYDGVFEITYVDKVTRRLLVRVLPKVFWGGHTKHRQVTQSASRSIDISGEKFPVYADGEKIGYGPVRISIHPGAMRVWQAQPINTP